MAIDGPHVLITGEPGAGKTSLVVGLDKSRPDWLRYFVAGDSRIALPSGTFQSFLPSIGQQLARQWPRSSNRTVSRLRSASWQPIRPQFRAQHRSHFIMQSTRNARDAPADFLARIASTTSVLMNVTEQAKRSAGGPR